MHSQTPPIRACSQRLGNVTCDVIRVGKHRTLVLGVPDVHDKLKKVPSMVLKKPWHKDVAKRTAMHDAVLTALRLAELVASHVDGGRGRGEGSGAHQGGGDGGSGTPAGSRLPLRFACDLLEKKSDV